VIFIYCTARAQRLKQLSTCDKRGERPQWSQSNGEAQPLQE